MAVSYPSLDAVAANPALLGLNANIDHSYIGIRDVLLAAPFLRAYPAITHFAGSRVQLRAKLEGKVGDLNIPALVISGLGSTSLKASGHLIGLPDPDKTYMDLALTDFRTTSSDINKMLPPGVMPEGYILPAAMQASGLFKGTLQLFNTDLAVHTSEGDARFNGGIDMRHPDLETYQGDLGIQNLNLGKLTGMQDMLGRVSLHTYLKGKSFNPKKASLALDGLINALELKGYTYKDLRFKADADQGKYRVNAGMEDPNLHFSLQGDADMTGAAPAGHMDLQLDSADFQALHLTTDTLKLHTHVLADFASADPDSLNGRMDITQLVLINGPRRLQADTLRFAAAAGPDSSSLSLDASALGLTAAMHGKYKLTKLAPAFQQLFNRYMAVDSLPALPVSAVAADSLAASPAHSKLAEEKAGSLAKAGRQPADTMGYQQFDFNARIFRTPMLGSFLPDLKRLDTIRIAGHFDNKEPALDIDGQIPKLVYGTDTLSEGQLTVRGDNGKLSYFTGFKHIAVGNTIQLEQPTLAGAAQHNQLEAVLNVHDNAGKDYYKVGALASIQGSRLQLKLIPDSLLLDYAPWKVQPDNYIQYDSAGVMIHNFGISDQGQELLVQSEPQLSGAALKINFKHFKIETLTKIVNEDSIQVGGLLSGQATIDSVMTSPLITADMAVNNLNFKSDTLGDIAVNIANKTADEYQTQISVTGQGNQVDLTGAYYTSPESKMDFVLNLQKLNLKSIEGFTLGYLKNMGGSLDGRMTLQGGFDSPKIGPAVFHRRPPLFWPSYRALHGPVPENNCYFADNLPVPHCF